MEFIIENYVWFIVGGIIILMAVVGYIADVTDFGRNRVEKQPKEKVEKIKPEKVKKEKIKKEKKKKNKNSEEIPTEQEIIEPSNNEFENQPTEMMEEIPTENPNDVLVEQDITTLNDVSEMPEETTEVDQSLFEPLPSIDQVFSNPTEETTEQEDVASDDDIWKF